MPNEHFRYKPGTWQRLRYEDRCKLQLRALELAAQDLVAVCKALPGMRSVYAYGSYARGAVGPMSDLDALIIRQTDASRTERESDIRQALNSPVGFDLLVVTPEEFEHRLPFTGIGRDILRDVKLLADFSEVSYHA